MVIACMWTAFTLHTHPLGDCVEISLLLEFSSSHARGSSCQRARRLYNPVFSLLVGNGAGSNPATPTQAFADKL